MTTCAAKYDQAEGAHQYGELAYSGFTTPPGTPSHTYCT